MGEIVKCSIKELPTTPFVFEGTDILKQIYDWLIYQKKYYQIDKSTVEIMMSLFDIDKEIAEKLLQKYIDGSYLEMIYKDKF